MTDLFAARSQMAMSLGFHMIFAIIGIGMPLLMVIAEALWLRTGEAVYKTLAKRWAKGTAILFAVGAVSGTVLSFELGLLWPGFMEHAGPIIGMPFSLEGFAFFFEAIFLGIYLYGWDKVKPAVHLAAGVGVWVSGTLSGVFVVCANAWMNNPTGFTLHADGTITDIDQVAAMLNPGSFGQTLHMTVAAFLATGFAVAGIHAWMLLKDRHNLFHQRALAIALGVGVVAAALQPATGHVIAHHMAHAQPLKMAAAEAQWETMEGAPFTIGGWPDEQAEETRYKIEIPKLLSLVAYNDPNAEVKGLKHWPADERPPVAVVHVAYQIMLGTMAVMGSTAGVGVLLVLWRRRLPLDTPYLWMVVVSAPMGFIGIEAGWTVTEVGRQPWVIYKVMRTSEAVTPMPGLAVTFLMFSALYLVLGLVVLSLLRRQFSMSPYIPEEGADGG